MLFARKHLQPAEAHAEKGAVHLVWAELRKMSLDHFGEFFIGLPNPEYPALSRVLPSMASAEVQRNWTGNDGPALLRQTIDFTRSVEQNFWNLMGRRLAGERILDFGCGYGRIARLMYYFADPADMYCVDPWEESIRLCRESRMPGNFFVSDYLPQSLPVPEQQFGLIYAFSVFTHLSERATRTALDTLRRYVAPNGMLVITIRPEEYWRSAKVDPFSNVTADELLAKHRERGFAFAPHRRAPIDGDITYGDTSFTMEWLSMEFPAWRVAAVDRSPGDPFQVLLFLTPRSG